METDLYRKQYDFELDQRAHLGSSANIPITAATFLFGGIAALAMNYDHDTGRLTALFIVLLGGALASLSVAIYFIFRSFLGYVYKKLPSMSELREHHDELIKWHQTAISTEEAANRDFEDYLRDRLVEAADRNGANNVARSAFIYRATLSIAISVVFICFSSLIFLYQGIDSRSDPQRVQVVGEVNVTVGGSSDE